MKKILTSLILGTAIYLIPFWNAVSAQVPPEFTGSLFYSPALTWGYSGSWDELAVFIPTVFHHDGTFYMFYTGLNGDAIGSIGLATSSDGYEFEKFPGNPVLTHSSSGFDSFQVARGAVTEDPSGWVMYYSARDLAGFGPGPYIGRATATELTGPWTRSSEPVLTVGSPDEWDNGYIEPDNVFMLDDGSYIMFYHAGDYPSGVNFQIGMATSPDGLSWTKYDDPATTDPPYAESDPVLKYGDPGDWDDKMVWLASVLANDEGYEMYYTGWNYNGDWGFGYATSTDGIKWTKYPSNPIYTVDDDPYALENGYNIIQGPAAVFNGLTAFMYYSYNVPSPGVIGMATGLITGIEDQSKVGGSRFAVRSYPNPTYGIFNVQFTVYNLQRITLKIYDINGREVAVVLDKNLPAGEHIVRFDMSVFPSGVYFYRLMTADCQLPTVTGKLVKY